MNSYIRIKRFKLCLFLHCDLQHDTILVIKERIEMLDGHPVMHQRLLLGKQVLENNMTLWDCGIEKEDQCLTLVKRANEDSPWEDPREALEGPPLEMLLAQQQLSSPAGVA